MTIPNDLICTWPSCGHTARGQCQHINAIPAAPDTPEVLALVEALRKARQDFWTAYNRFRDEDYEGPIPRLTVTAVCHAKPYFDKHMQHLSDAADSLDATIAAWEASRDR